MGFSLVPREGQFASLTKDYKQGQDQSFPLGQSLSRLDRPSELQIKY